MRAPRLRFAALLLSAITFTAAPSEAQVTGPISTALQGGLVNVNVQDVANNLSNLIVVDIDRIDILNDVEIDVLRNGVVEILSNNSNFLNNWTLLNNVLRDARFLNGNQVAIGILSGGVGVPMVIFLDRNLRLP